jgi:Mrp family chromosome partitioning ATPase
MAIVEQNPDLRRITFSVFQVPSDNKNTAWGKIIAVTSPIPGEGVTHVSRLMCHELSRDPKRRTLYCTIEALSKIPASAASEIERFCARNDAGYWVLSNDEDTVTDWDFDSAARRAVIEPLRRLFDYVILDCPAVCDSADVSSVARLVNSVFLVVGAGMSTRKQVGYTERVILSAGGTLGGCILNRRRSHIPKFLQRLLGGDWS